MGTIPFSSSFPASLSSSILSNPPVPLSHHLEPPTPEPPPVIPEPAIPVLSSPIPPQSKFSTASPAAPPPAWNALFKSRPANAGQYVPRDFSLVFQGDAIVPPPDVIQAGNGIWSEYVVGFFLDHPLPYSTVIYYLNKAWKLKGSFIVKSDGFLFLFKFSSDEDRRRIAESDPVVMRGKLFIVKPWDNKVGNSCASIRSVPVWIKLTNIPLYAWSHIGINWLASRIGSMLCMDSSTEKLERISFAKCLVDINPNKELPDNFSVKLLDGSEQLVHVEYLWRPNICTLCKEFGHSTVNCLRGDSVKQANVEANENVASRPMFSKVVRPAGKDDKAKQVWKKVNSAKNRKEVKKIGEHSGSAVIRSAVSEVILVDESVNVAGVNVKGPKGTVVVCNNKFDVLNIVENENEHIVIDDIEEGELVSNQANTSDSEIVHEHEANGLNEVNEEEEGRSGDQVNDYSDQINVSEKVKLKQVEAYGSSSATPCVVPTLDMLNEPDPIIFVQTRSEQGKSTSKSSKGALKRGFLNTSPKINKSPKTSLPQLIVDTQVEVSPLVWCSISETWSHPASGLCYHSREKVFSKWISNVELDEREIFYWLVDDELVICNEGEYGANNEAIIAAKDWDRRFIFSARSPGYRPDIFSWFRRCAGIR